MKSSARAASAALCLFALIVCLSTSAAAQENLALTGTAVQSSDWGAGQFPASRANDGDYGNFTATGTSDEMAAWEVDLGAPAEIERVVVYNRGDGCCQSRLRDITVTVREFSLEDDPFGDEDPLFESELLNEENELGGGGTGGPPELIVELDEPVTGRYVRVTRLPDPDLSGTGGAGNADEPNVLSIGEVEVFGTLMPECPPEGDAEHGDTHCTGISIEAPFDEGPGVYVVSGAGKDDTGDTVLYTFIAENQAGGPTLIVGPGTADFAELTLSVGEWILSVVVDDTPICDDEAADAVCSELVVVEGVGEGRNVALDGVATQSSDYAAQYGAGQANDGDLGNFTATASGDDMATWEVELDATYPINAIVIHNRGDGCCQSRLRDITAFILDENGDVQWESELLNEENELGGGTTDGPVRLALDIHEMEGHDVEGRIVRITRLPDADLSGTGGAGNADEANVMSLGEVEVFAAERPAAILRKTGDVNGDGTFNISDPVAHLGFLFSSGAIPECYVVIDAGQVTLTPTGTAILDFNGDGASNIADAVGSLNFLFGGGAAHALGEGCAEVDGDCESNCAE